MREDLPAVAENVVRAIVEEVPSYVAAFEGSMGETIRNAVQLALGGFLTLASGRRGVALRTPAPAMEGAYQLGRGEARSQRTTDALLAAYRIGARVSWREMAGRAVDAGVDGSTLAAFAELVFAYIDELSAASVAGHEDELASTGRVRARQLERLARALLDGSAEEVVLEAAERADWTPPTTLTAVLVPRSQARPVLGVVPAATLEAGDLAGMDELGVLLVPDAHGRSRSALLHSLRGRGAVAGPARPWLEARTSYARARRAHALGLEGDTEEHLPALVLTADPEALADLRSQALAPLADLRPAAAEKLTETLRSWLLHQGRREDVAADLFVHPQTVRYRLGQLRELYGDRLEDPRTVLGLTLALGVAEPHEVPDH
ncbi:helix-turn-helix domain-containing protein [Nocardioides sp. zg-578]|uniref:PucR family transcriptional regulator n=2 Tax=Nocardioides marmotae TaxID=2663857 RepID=A0A6I3JFK2_9ACTN|nr:helix-turn-helix domain-containing protein [Nocardioides marmotae]MCR6033086.1 PucR family transcriptional regulator [Gordonia jinghuaiqii]MTB83705.1 PucR family transcriptional regulator [Nocardioides marmotae]MTB96738.1 PucR family transcriptional regulator [Nocardioides marmotae]QKE03696.1 helix-turn-helix domain-containing protein [Nocardioides marmotae]